MDDSVHEDDDEEEEEDKGIPSTNLAGNKKT